MALGLTPTPGYQPLTGAGNSRRQRRTEGLPPVASSANANSSAYPSSVAVLPSRSGFQRVTRSSFSAPQFHYSSQNALRGEQTDALPLFRRLGEAFPIPSVLPPSISGAPFSVFGEQGRGYSHPFLSQILGREWRPEKTN